MSDTTSSSRITSLQWLNISTVGPEEVSRAASTGALYAILDACSSHEIPQQVTKLGNQRGLCLYRDHAASNFTAQAPYLVSVDHSVLDWINAELRDKQWGVFILSQRSLLELYTHLRKFLTVDSPTGERWIFRYYDPRVLPPFLTACNEVEIAEFFSGMEAFILARPGNSAAKFQKGAGLSASSTSRRGGGGRFRLRAPHLAALYPLVNAHVPDGLFRTLQEKGHAVEKDPSSGEITGRDTRGFETRLSFGKDNLPNRLTLPSGAAWSFENDSSGLIRKLTLPGGERLELEHDERGRLVSASQPGRAVYRFEYATHDLLTAIHHPDGTREDLQYTEDGKISAMVGRAGDIRKYLYEEGRLHSSIDPLGRRTIFEWDKTGGLASITLPDGTQEHFEYDPVNRVATQIARNGSLVFRQLDEKGDLEEISWEDGTSIRLSVDEGGYLRAAENEHARTEYVYDGTGRLISERTAGEDTIYEYDGDGRLTALAPSSKEVIRYKYDEDGHLCGILAWGQHLSIENTPLGMMKTIRYGNGLLEKREHDCGGRLSHAHVTDLQGKCLSDQRYTYDACERLSSIVDTTEIHAPPKERRLEYDRGSRLIRDTMRQAGGSLRDTRYAYDACGNMIQDGEVRLQIGQMDEIRARGHRSIAYDELGQITRLPNRTGELECRYNADGTLQQVRSGDTLLIFTYDAFGRRIGATDGQRSWRYGWAGLQLLWEELSESPDAIPVRRDYLYLPEGLSPVAFRENNRTFWNQHDTRGAVIRTFDDTGKIVWQAHYDSFGEAQVEIALVRQPWRLAGQYEDASTGLHYNLGRYYSPLVKSYLSRDPQWFRHGATAYSYCSNDPWNRVDPHGQWAWIAAGAVLGAVVGGVIAAVEGKSPLEVAAAALEGAAIGAAFAVNPIAGAAALMAADIIHQGLEQGWSNVCVPCAAGKAVLALIFGAILGRALGFLGRQIGRALGWLGRHIGNAARLAGRSIARWAQQAGQAIKKALSKIRRIVIRPPKVIVKEGKWDYFFGRVTSNPHNTQRSLQNAKDLAELGIKEAKGGREKLMKIFEKGLKNPPTGKPHITEHGTTITRTVEVPPKGAIDVKYFYPKHDMSATPEVSTIIPKIFK